MLRLLTARSHFGKFKQSSRPSLSYRFKKDEKSWRVFVSTALTKADSIRKKAASYWIDLNADHIAI